MAKAKLKFNGLIRQMREMKVYTQKRVADKVEVSQSYYSDLERGHKLPTPHFVRAFCRACNVNKRGRQKLERLAAAAHGWEV